MTNDATTEAVARAICRAHRIGFGNMSEADKQETEDKAWDKHIPDALAAIKAHTECSGNPGIEHCVITNEDFGTPDDAISNHIELGWNAAFKWLSEQEKTP